MSGGLDLLTGLGENPGVHHPREGSGPASISYDAYGPQSVLERSLFQTPGVFSGLGIGKTCSYSVYGSFSLS